MTESTQVFFCLHAGALFTVLVAHALRAQLSLGLILALGGLLNFCVWLISATGWWMVLFSIPFEAGHVALAPAIFVGLLILYIMDGVRLARVYIVILILCSLFAIAYGEMMEKLAHFEPIPSLFFRHISNNLIIVFSYVAAGILAILLTDVCRRHVPVWIAVAVAQVVGILSLLIFMSLMQYGVQHGLRNIATSIPVYGMFGLSTAFMLGVYVRAAARRGVVLPPPPMAALIRQPVFAGIEDQGPYRSLIEAHQTIAELRQLTNELKSEKKFREIQFAKSRLPLFEIDANANITKLNDAAERLLNSIKGPVDKSPARSLDDVFSGFSGMIADEAGTSKTFSLVPLAGDPLTMDVTVLPSWRGGRVCGMTVIAEDVSEREKYILTKRIEDRLEALRFASKMFVHDLANLLSAVESNVATLEKHLSDEVGTCKRTHLDAIYEALRFGRQMIRRFSSGGFPHVRGMSASDLSDIISSAVRMCDPAAKTGGVRLCVEDIAAVRMSADANEIIRVLVNLIHNAVRASHPGDQIAIAGSVDEQGVTITVSDTGVGMTEDQLRQAFDAGFSTKSPGEGGLGLTIGRMTAKAFGGRLDLESVPGRGTKARLWLPRAATVSRLAPDSRPLDISVAIVYVADDRGRAIIVQALDRRVGEVQEALTFDEFCDLVIEMREMVDIVADVRASVMTDSGRAIAHATKVLQPSVAVLLIDKEATPAVRLERQSELQEVTDAATVLAEMLSDQLMDEASSPLPNGVHQSDRNRLLQ